MNPGRIDYGVPYERPVDLSSLAQEDVDSEEAFYRKIGYVSPEDESSDVLENIDPQEAFYRKLGYLPPWDEETAAIMDAIIRDPTTAMEYARRNPTSDEFYAGLYHRDVDKDEAKTPDLYADINHLPEYSLQETDAERECYERLWTLDRARCVHGSSHALFRQTFMMGFIARHCLIYGQSATTPSCLDFSVEEPWTCPPMPTGDSYLSNKFLTQPKPDLAICFKRDKVMRDSIYCLVPSATQRLACYENPDYGGSDKAFHFFTIETARWTHPDTITTAEYRNLNNASQALHNMFQFFQDAGPHHKEKIFSQVRFFSVVASALGLNVRIHRAIELSEKVAKSRHGYPLKFEYREFAEVTQSNFDRGTVVELFGRILHGYGVGKLLDLLQDAAKSLIAKLDRDKPEGHWLRANPDFYRYGHGDNTAASSRKQTPTTSRWRSVESHMSVDAERSGMLPGLANIAAPRPDQSIDMAQSPTVTPTQSHPSPLMQAPSTSGKRVRSPYEDDNPPQKTRGRKSLRSGSH